MSLHGRILHLACHWQASNFDIKREIVEVQPLPLSSSFFPSRQRCSSPPSRPSRPPPLEFEIVEEMRESVEGITLTPMYQRRRLCISMPEAMHKPSVDVNGPDYYPQRASLTECQTSRQALETVWEVESESEPLDTREYNGLTADSRNDELFTPPDNPLGSARIIQSGPYATSRNDYSEKTEKFEKIMEQMEQLYHEASDLEWGESQKEESLGPQRNQERFQ